VRGRGWGGHRYPKRPKSADTLRTRCYDLAHSRIKGTSLLCMVVLGIDFGHNSCPIA
jgi:hypothetical protein